MLNENSIKNGVVILNYNSHDLTIALVNQISKYDAIYKICVVDNNSGDNFDNEFINNNKVHFIKNKNNLGYNAGNNVGLKYLVNELGCNYVYIANPDVDFENSAISEMTDAMRNDDRLVICTTKRFGMDNSLIHQYFEFPSLSDSLKKCFILGRKNFKKNNHIQQNIEIDNYDGVKYVDAVPGAFFGIKAKFLKEIDFLYEGVFLYGEEIFLGQQAYRMGYKAGIINTSCYYHNHIQQSFSKSNKKMFLYDRLSLVKYFKYFKLLNPFEIMILSIAIRIGSLEYNLLALIYNFLKKNKEVKKHKLCSRQASNYRLAKKFKVENNEIDNIKSAEEYVEYIANGNLKRFLELGHAVAGHNGPHGHIDTPVRNTAHYLIIYSYLYKKYKKNEYGDICEVFFNYLKKQQSKSKSGAIKCMENSKFDHLNGLIGQAWVIEALIYYYETFYNKEALGIAYKIFKSQEYDYKMHIWKRVELDGTNIGYDNTYNHQVWFAACSYKLGKYCKDLEIENIIEDFLQNGARRDFRVYLDGLMRHNINISTKSLRKEKVKRLIKQFLTPLKALNAKKFDYKYIEKAYHIFDIYGFSILEEEYKRMPIFSSKKYEKAVEYANDINKYDLKNDVEKYKQNGKKFNVYSYSYNSPAFEYPYVSILHGVFSVNTMHKLFDTQKELMFDYNTGLMSRNNPDIETWNAKTYEIVRYLDKKNRNTNDNGDNGQ